MEHLKHSLTKKPAWKSRKMFAFLLVLVIYCTYLYGYKTAVDWKHNAVTSTMLAVMYVSYVFCQSMEDVVLLFGVVKTLVHGENK